MHELITMHVVAFIENPCNVNFLGGNLPQKTENNI